MQTRKRKYQDVFARTLTQDEQKAKQQAALCTAAAVCGDVNQLKAAMGPMSDDPDFLDGCLDDLVAQAVPRGHMNILQHLATCKPGGSWSTAVCGLAAGRGRLDMLQWARLEGCPWDSNTVRQACFHKQEQVLKWLQSQDLPCPQTPADKLCSHVAAVGKTDLLAQLRSTGYAWTADTSYAAFISGQYETLFWLRNQQPPCPWTPLPCYWKKGFPRGASSSPALPLSKAQIRMDKGSTLLRLLSAAASPRTGAAPPAFFADLIVEALTSMLTSTGLLAMQDAVRDVASAGHLEAMRWLRQHFPSEIVLDPIVCQVAAQKGQIAMLELLRNSDPPCPWDIQSCIRAAVSRCQVAMLEWFHSHGHASLAGCRFAARQGNQRMLEVLRAMDPPWPWDASVFIAASRQPPLLQWLSAQVPPCPFTARDAERCSSDLAEMADVDLLKKLQLPIQDMPKLCLGAAERGRLGLLRWLVQQQPPCPLSPWVCEIAVRRNDVAMVRFLVAEHSPATFPVQQMQLIEKRRPACFLLLAQAGCPMRPGSTQEAVTALVDAWLTYMGLHRWAGNQINRTSRLPSTVGSYSSCGAWQNAAGLPVVTPELKQLAQLPIDLVEKIASQAFLSPQQASSISFRPRPPSDPTNDDSKDYFDDSNLE